MATKRLRFVVLRPLASVLICLLTVCSARADLVAHWPLNEGTGDVFQDVVGGFDGFLPEAEFDEQTEIEWDEGPPTQDHAVRFLGVNSFIATNFPGIGGASPRTVTFWFRTLDTDAYFLGWGTNFESEKWHIRLNVGGGVMRTEFQGGQNFATTNLIDDEWHHVASVFPEGAVEGEEILHYVDGELDPQAGGTSLEINTAIVEEDFEDWFDANSFDPYPVHFGAVLGHGFGRQLDGLMADIRIYDEGLSQEEIRAIMEGGDGLLGDYNGNGELDAGDLDLQAEAIVMGNHPKEFDLNDDGFVDGADRDVWVRDLKRTWFGDADLNLEFNSSDFVAVFAKGKYEKGLDAGWAEGDWTGDKRFGSSDFVKAFVDGGYEKGQRLPAAVVTTVPEPAAAILLAIGLIGLVGVHRRQ
jgi:hypothetical protein